MSMANFYGSAKSAMGSAKTAMVGSAKNIAHTDYVGSAKSGMTAVVGSAKKFSQNLKVLGKNGEEGTPSPSNKAQTEQVPRRNGMDVFRDLKVLFPDWDDQALKEVILNSKGNMDDCIKTITSWTADDDGTSTNAMRELNDKLNIVAEDLIPPPVEERKLLDTVLEKRLSAKVEGQGSGQNTPKSMQAFNMVKAFAKSAHETVLKHTKGGQSANAVPAAPISDAGGWGDEAEVSRAQKIKDGRALLAERLGKWSLETLEIVDDGNCQFRAFSMELFGTEAYHLAVRSSAVNYLREHAEEYSSFCPEDMTWEQYLEGMSKSRYWGDQLTLIAACQSYGVIVHMISTEQENWHLMFEPHERKWPFRRVFLAYISPIHYTVIKPVSLK